MNDQVEYNLYKEFRSKKDYATSLCYFLMSLRNYMNTPIARHKGVTIPADECSIWVTEFDRFLEHYDEFLNRSSNQFTSNEIDAAKAQELGRKYSCPCHGFGDCQYEAEQSALEMAQWKEEEYRHEMADIRCLVEMIPVNETNQSIIDDLKNILPNQ